MNNDTIKMVNMKIFRFKAGKRDIVYKIYVIEK